MDHVQRNQLKSRAVDTFLTIGLAGLRFLEMRQLAMFIQCKIEGFLYACCFKCQVVVGSLRAAVLGHGQEKAPDPR